MMDCWRRAEFTERYTTYNCNHKRKCCWTHQSITQWINRPLEIRLVAEVLD